MLISEIEEHNFPHVNLSDKVSFALGLMDDYDIQHLPVLAHEEKFAGLISKDDLLDADENATIYSLEQQLIKTSVLPQDHFVSAIKIASQTDVSVVPVVAKSGELQGVVTLKILIRTTNTFLSAEIAGGMIVLEMDKRNFSFGELSRLVETNDAYITELNTHIDTESGLLIATIKINKREISDIVASLQRYDYNILHYFGEELYENELKENYDLLMNYLNI